MKQKFVLEFDEAPPLVIVQKSLKEVEIYQNGKRVEGAKSIEYKATVDEVPTHKIGYYTCWS